MSGEVLRGSRERLSGRLRRILAIEPARRGPRLAPPEPRDGRGAGAVRPPAVPLGRAKGSGERSEIQSVTHSRDAQRRMWSDCGPVLFRDAHEGRLSTPANSRLVHSSPRCWTAALVDLAAPWLTVACQTSIRGRSRPTLPMRRAGPHTDSRAPRPRPHCVRGSLQVGRRRDAEFFGWPDAQSSGPSGGRFSRPRAETSPRGSDARGINLGGRR